MARRKSKFPLSLAVAAVVVFLVGSLYIAYSRGTGPFSGLFSTPEVLPTLPMSDTPELNAGAAAQQVINTAVKQNKDPNSAEVKKAAETAAKKAAQDTVQKIVETKVVTDNLTVQEAAQEVVKEVLPPEQAAAITSSTSPTQLISQVADKVVENPVVQKVVKTPTTDTCSVPGANAPIKPGYTYATGYGLKIDDNGKLSRCLNNDYSCTLRECYAYNQKCEGEKVVCGDALLQDPTKVVLPVQLYNQTLCNPYTNTTTNRCVLTGNSCYTDSGSIPTGTYNQQGEYCMNGEFYNLQNSTQKDKVQAEGNKFCILPGQIFNLISAQCEMPQSGSTHNIVTNIEIPIVKPVDCTGTTVYRETNGIGKCVSSPRCNTVEDCARGEYCVDSGFYGRYCQATKPTTPNQTLKCNGNVLMTWNSVNALWTRKYCSDGCDPSTKACRSPAAGQQVGGETNYIEDCKYGTVGVGRTKQFECARGNGISLNQPGVTFVGKTSCEQAGCPTGLSCQKVIGSDNAYQCQNPPDSPVTGIGGRRPNIDNSNDIATEQESSTKSPDGQCGVWGGLFGDGDKCQSGECIIQRKNGKSSWYCVPPPDVSPPTRGNPAELQDRTTNNSALNLSDNPVVPAVNPRTGQPTTVDGTRPVSQRPIIVNNQAGELGSRPTCTKAQRDAQPDQLCYIVGGAVIYRPITRTPVIITPPSTNSSGTPTITFTCPFNIVESTGFQPSDSFKLNLGQQTLNIANFYLSPLGSCLTQEVQLPGANTLTICSRDRLTASISTLDRIVPETSNQIQLLDSICERNP